MQAGSDMHKACMHVQSFIAEESEFGAKARLRCGQNLCPRPTEFCADSEPDVQYTMLAKAEQTITLLGDQE